MNAKRNKVRPAKPAGSISASVVRIGNSARLNRKRWINVKIQNGGLTDSELAQAA
ncbi:MAG: hypothetical protein ACPGVU_06935 [Limisphaerales bacterium]